MNSEDTIKKFDNIVRLRTCVHWHPVMDAETYAAIMYLDGNRYNSASALLPIHFYINEDMRRN